MYDNNTDDKYLKCYEWYNNNDDADVDNGYHDRRRRWRW